MNRKSIRSKGFRFILLLFLVVITSCSTMSLTAEWKDQQYKGNGFKKYIVIGLFKKLAIRQAMEDSITGELKKSGVDAISSLTVLTPDRELKRNDKDLDNFLHKLGIDGILIVKLAGLDKTYKYIPGSTYYSAVPAPGVPYREPYMSYYYNYYQSVSVPGYYENFVSVLVECSLFANSNNKLVWKAELRSIPYDEGAKELSTPTSTAKDLSRIIIKEFKRNNFIPNK